MTSTVIPSVGFLYYVEFRHADEFSFCHNARCHYAECYYVECRYNKCRGAPQQPTCRVTATLIINKASDAAISHLGSIT